MSQSHQPSALTVLALVCVILACGLSTGCATFGDSSAFKLPGTSGPDGADPTAAPQEHCTVVLQPGRGEQDVVQVPLTGGATVQTALDQSKATRKFRRMEIYVLRKPPSRGNRPSQVQKMNVEFNRKRRRVDAEYDYALYPNDRVVVQEDMTTIIDDTVEAVAGRMGIPIVTQLMK